MFVHAQKSTRHFCLKKLNIFAKAINSKVNKYLISWWSHQMEIFSVLLVLCVGFPLVTGEFPSQRSVTRSSDGFFDKRLNNWLSDQSRRQWFETPSRLLWRHCNVYWKKMRGVRRSAARPLLLLLLFFVYDGFVFSQRQCAIMMMSSNGNKFRITGHLCREFAGHRWIPRTKVSDAELWCFLWFVPE